MGVGPDIPVPLPRSSPILQSAAQRAHLPHARQAGVLLPLFSIRSPADWGVGEIPDLVPSRAGRLGRASRSRRCCR